ncbi:MAG: Ig-like domain-containing protein [Oscillospiraceae bacterium]|nr:Ig-like domain-containing protein [Oscillospiraceae bacterium]
MSKIICDICATVYPDTADVCPICGYPRENSRTVADEDVPGSAAPAAGAAAYSPVKGGRFSNKNVQKRRQAVVPADAPRSREPRQEKPKASPGLIAIVVLLIIGILLVSFYIGWRFYKGRDAYDNPKVPETTAPGTQVPQTTEPAETGVPCVGLTVSDSNVTFTEAGKAWKLSVTTTPADTTDGLVLTSSDESVVKVSMDGVLTAVGPGTATITITCGDVTRTCQVTCDFPEETTAPTQTTAPTEPTEPEETTKPTEPNKEGLKLSHSDVTFFSEGESFRLTIKYNGETVSPAVVSFSVKDDTIATVEPNGKVTAVSGGTTTVTVTYNGETAKCIIRCNFETAEPDETEDTEPTEDTGWQISHTDVTLKVGEAFTLRLKNAAGETAEVAWSVSTEGVVDISGNRITGLTAGRVTISATIDGETFSCIVRVK